MNGVIITKFVLIQLFNCHFYKKTKKRNIKKSYFIFEMDSLNSEEVQDNNSNVSPSLKAKGAVIIQLEGTHTTSTETESSSFKEKKIVKFEEASKENLTIQQTSIEDEAAKDQETEIELQEVCVVEKRDDYEASEALEKSLAVEVSELKKEDSDSKGLQDVAVKNLEISERFQQIMNMFDNFTKNLETLDLAVKPITKRDLTKRIIQRKRPESLSSAKGYEFEEPSKHRSRYDEFMGAVQNKGKILRIFVGKH